MVAPTEGSLDVERLVADQAADVPGRDEHRVDAGPLERQHLVAVLDVDLRDRELPGGDVGQQLEHGVERVDVRRRSRAR